MSMSAMTERMLSAAGIATPAQCFEPPHDMESRPLAAHTPT